MKKGEDVPKSKNAQVDKFRYTKNCEIIFFATYVDIIYICLMDWCYLI